MKHREGLLGDYFTRTVKVSRAPRVSLINVAFEIGRSCLDLRSFV